MEYKKLVNRLTPKESSILSYLKAFIGGGLIGVVAYYLDLYFGTDIMLVIFIIIASILTGIGVFDDLIDIFKMGLVIPITGFSHSITSCMMEYKREGFITGIGSNCFKLAGSVILYGIIGSSILNLIGGLIK